LNFIAALSHDYFDKSRHNPCAAALCNGVTDPFGYTWIVGSYPAQRKDLFKRKIGDRFPEKIRGTIADESLI
jgi:hypothetical protein